MEDIWVLVILFARGFVGLLHYYHLLAVGRLGWEGRGPVDSQYVSVYTGLPPNAAISVYHPSTSPLTLFSTGSRRRRDSLIDENRVLPFSAVGGSWGR